MRPIAIDLFAGAGGLSMGFEQAGFDVVGAVEIDPVHCAVHKFNFPNSAVIAASVTDLSGAEIRLRTGIGVRDIDCVMGGAPCQGFSTIGHRVLDDPRNRLVKDFVRLVDQLAPKYFVFENVKGITTGKHRAVLEEIIDAFGEIGYDVRLPWQVLNAANFGTPQSRERLILMGARTGLGIPNYPIPTHNIPGRKPHDIKLPIGPNCFDALGDLPNADGFESLKKIDSVKTNKFGSTSHYASEMRCTTNKPWHHGYPRLWKPNVLTSSARTEHTDISKRRFKETPEGTVEPISRFFKLPSLGVANTLRAGTDGARGAFTSPRPIHYKYDRCVTVREMARLHGFPDWFRFNVTKWHGARQIGNAVPPPLARAIIELGNPELLSYAVTDASKYFDIPIPSNKRDRKSGAKKRKQVDIERERLLALTAHGQ